MYFGDVSSSREIFRVIDTSHQLREALKMLYDLLEAYAPAWYTEEHHDKAKAALHNL